MVGIWASLRLDFAFFNVLFHVIWAYLWVDWAFLWVVSIQIWGWQNGLIRPLPGLLLIVLGKCDNGLEEDGWIKTLFQPVLNEINLGRTCHLPSNPLTAPSLHISFFYYRFFLWAMFMYFWILSDWINMRPQCCCGSGRCSHLSEYKHSSMVLKLKIYVELIGYFISQRMTPCMLIFIKITTTHCKLTFHLLILSSKKICSCIYW